MNNVLFQLCKEVAAHIEVKCEEPGQSLSKAALNKCIDAPAYRIENGTQGVKLQDLAFIGRALRLTAQICNNIFSGHTASMSLPENLWARIPLRPSGTLYPQARWRSSLDLHNVHTKKLISESTWIARETIKPTTFLGQYFLYAKKNKTILLQQYEHFIKKQGHIILTCIISVLLQANCRCSINSYH